MEIKIACAQVEVRPGRPEINLRKALETIEEAKRAGIDILIFPEQLIPGYLLGDLWEQRAFLRDCRDYGEDLIAATQDICVIFGNIALDETAVNEDGRPRKYNAAFIAQDGALKKGGLSQAFISKTALPDYREFDDSRYFHSLAKLLPLQPGKTLEDLIQPVSVTIRGEEVKLGVLICEDGWTENYDFNVPQILTQNGAQLLINISCSPFTLQLSLIHI